MSNLEFSTQVSEIQRSQATAKAGEVPAYGKPDILFVLFIYLMQVVNNNQKSAELQAKQLQANALEQVNYNQEDQRINLASVPQEIKHYTYIHHSKWHWHDPFTAPLLTHQTWVSKVLKSDNDMQIDMAQSQNETSNDTRQGIASKLAVLGQIAQGEQVNMNTATDQASQAISQSSGFLAMIKAITQKIEVNH